MAPLIRMNVARTLHFAAVFFALGIIVSLLVRGFGTSYWAGWESTWLAESPESVKAFIDHTYGLIPAVGPLSSMPDLAQIVDMRADRLPYLEAPITAAPWLIRMMILMGVTVIVPRLFLPCLTHGVCDALKRRQRCPSIRPTTRTFSFSVLRMRFLAT